MSPKPVGLIPETQHTTLYRLYWLSWLWTNPETRSLLQVEMDAEQQKIQKGHWSGFCVSLPGHKEFWSKQIQEIQTQLG